MTERPGLTLVFCAAQIQSPVASSTHGISPRPAGLLPIGLPENLQSRGNRELRTEERLRVDGR
jgi:hypothetical protein